MTEPVGVVMAARNAERFIGEALESIVTQTVPPSTVVVVDDGSTDATAEIAARFAPLVRVLRRPHAGISPSRNLGIASVETPLVAFLDADDLWLPTKLERQHEALRDEPGKSAVFCLVDEFLDATVPDDAGVRAPMMSHPAPLSSAAFLRREVIERLGPFRESVVGDWVEWWGRARAMGVREHVVPEVLIRRRIHGGNNSVVHSDGGHTFIGIAREHLREIRRRSPGSDAR
jgi:glycosyltransferase involved in cell wall biosynthesis